MISQSSLACMRGEFFRTMHSFVNLTIHISFVEKLYLRNSLRYCSVVHCSAVSNNSLIKKTENPGKERQERNPTWMERKNAPMGKAGKL